VSVHQSAGGTRLERWSPRNGIAVYRKLCRVRDRIFCLAVAGSFSGFGKGTVIQLPLHVEGERRISLGTGVFIGPSCWLLTLDDRASLKIGDRTSVSGHCVIASAQRVTIGASVLIARGVFIADHSHDRSIPGASVRESGITQIAPVSIGDGSWLGQNAVVLPGVTIGAGAVIGANSVVRHDVPSGGVAVGAPARVLGIRRIQSDAAATD